MTLEAYLYVMIIKFGFAHKVKYLAYLKIIDFKKYKMIKYNT